MEEPRAEAPSSDEEEAFITNETGELGEGQVVADLDGEGEGWDEQKEACNAPA
jgi:hypothetical protein